MAEKTAQPKTKFFRVAVEGATATDGRTIKREWLSDIAETYKRETYGARVNMEHIRGFSPAAPFNAYGDVLAVKTEEITLSIGGKDEKRLALFAQIDPTDDLVKLTKARQKIYTSIEVSENFGGSGKAGLVGLAVTDSPASLGTEILAFSAKPENAAVKAMLDARKQDPANAFSAAEETSIEFEGPVVEEKSALEKFAELVTGGLHALSGGKKEEPTTPVITPANPATPAADPTAAFGAMMTQLTTALAEDRRADRAAQDAAFAELRKEIAGVKKDIETTPSGSNFSRSPATGGDGRELTDC